MEKLSEEIWNISSNFLRSNYIRSAIKDIEITPMNACSLSFLGWNELDESLKNDLLKYFGFHYKSNGYHKWKIAVENEQEKLR